jgi:RNA polymerase sigma factor (sigma-70 family)
LDEFSQTLSVDSPSDNDSLLTESIAAKHIKEAVEKLPDQERHVLLLHVNNGLTYWEIAHRLRVDEEVVLRDLSRAYSQLRLELSMDELRR